MSFLVRGAGVDRALGTLGEACKEASYLSCVHDGSVSVVQRIAGFDLEIYSYELGQKTVMEDHALAVELEGGA